MPSREGWRGAGARADRAAGGARETKTQAGGPRTARTSARHRDRAPGACIGLPQRRFRPVRCGPGRVEAHHPPAPDHRSGASGARAGDGRDRRGARESARGPRRSGAIAGAPCPIPVAAPAANARAGARTHERRPLIPNPGPPRPVQAGMAPLLRVGRGLVVALLVVAACAAVPESTSPFQWPSSEERVRGWQEDLDSALTAFLPRDRSFSPDARARFVREIGVLRDSIASLRDEQLVVRLATAVAGAGNAHTRLYLLRNRTVLRRYPIRLWWFGNDLCVIRAHPEHAELVGGRVLEIAGRPPLTIAGRVAPLYAANASWARYLSSYLLTSPEILSGVGVLSGSSDQVLMTIEPRHHVRRQVSLAPLPFERSDQPFEASWDLSPTHPGRQGPWVSVLPADTLHLPLYLRHLASYYWMERVAGDQTLYVQYNRSQDQPDGETVRDFGARVMRELDQ